MYLGDVSTAYGTDFTQPYTKLHLPQPWIDEMEGSVSCGATNTTGFRTRKAVAQKVQIPPTAVGGLIQIGLRPNFETTS